MIQTPRSRPNEMRIFDNEDMARRALTQRHALAGVLALLLLAPGTHTAAAAAHRHVVVLDQRGQGYAATRLYQVNPKKPWGVTYAFNCGRHAGDFGGDVWEV